MKFLVLLALTITLTSAKSFACSPPQYAFMSQTWLISTLLNDQKVLKAVAKVAGPSSYITNIRNEEGITFELSNNCSVTATAEWKKDTPPGLCPQLKGFKVKSACKE